MSEGSDSTAPIHRFFRAVDERDWERVAAGLAEEVSLDYTSVFGGTPEVLARDDVVAQWRALLPGFDATQHLVGPLVGNGNGVLEANVRGYHHLGEETWMVAGWYTLNVEDGEVLSGITLAKSYETGDRDLVERARDAAAP